MTCQFQRTRFQFLSIRTLLKHVKCLFNARKHILNVTTIFFIGDKKSRK